MDISWHEIVMEIHYARFKAHEMAFMGFLRDFHGILTKL